MVKSFQSGSRGVWFEPWPGSRVASLGNRLHSLSVSFHQRKEIDLKTNFWVSLTRVYLQLTNIPYAMKAIKAMIARRNSTVTEHFQWKYITIRRPVRSINCFFPVIYYFFVLAPFWYIDIWVKIALQLDGHLTLVLQPDGNCISNAVSFFLLCSSNLPMW